MKLKMYTVYDDAAQAFLQPFFFSTNAQAIRAFSELANDINHQFCKYASQYTLFELGEFDQATAAFNQIIPHSLGLAQEFKLPQHVQQSLPLLDSEKHLESLEQQRLAEAHARIFSKS